MALLQIAQSAYTAFSNKDKFWKVLKWVTLSFFLFLFIIFLIFTTVISVLQGFGKVSVNKTSSDPTQFSEFQDFSYKTISGDTWYEFKHPYSFPTLGVLTQGVILDSSAKVGLKHIAWDIADRKNRQTEVRAFADGIVESVNNNILYNTTRRWKFCEESPNGICWYQVKESADVQIGCGYEVIITHADNLKTQYCHLEYGPPFKVGDQISVGQTIGLQGSTGWATGKHLHFALWRGGQPIDPSYAFTQTSLSNWNK